jgi:predicted GNAT family acetyltransferase
MTDIVHREAQGRFECIVEGHCCELDYRLDGNDMVILHTGVPPEVGGRGIAADLTRATLDTARQRGWRVRPLCSYAAAYIRRHPEYADLVE